MKKKRCMARTKKGTRCKNKAIEDSLFCLKHNKNDGGNIQKPSGGGGKGPKGISHTIGKMTGGVAIKEIFSFIWDWLKENGDVFFTATQKPYYIKVKQKGVVEPKQKQLEKLLSTLSIEQWTQLLLAISLAIVTKTNKGKKTKVSK